MTGGGQMERLDDTRLYIAAKPKCEYSVLEAKRAT